jgi:hypothetical protein
VWRARLSVSLTCKDSEPGARQTLELPGPEARIALARQHQSARYMKRSNLKISRWQESSRSIPLSTPSTSTVVVFFSLLCSRSVSEGRRAETRFALSRGACHLYSRAQQTTLSAVKKLLSDLSRVGLLSSLVSSRSVSEGRREGWFA